MGQQAWYAVLRGGWGPLCEIQVEPELEPGIGSLLGCRSAAASCDNQARRRDDAILESLDDAQVPFQANPTVVRSDNQAPLPKAAAMHLSCLTCRHWAAGVAVERRLQPTRRQLNTFWGDSRCPATNDLRSRI